MTTPRPDLPPRNTSELDDPLSAERLLQRSFASLLGVANVRPGDSFLALGGSPSDVSNLTAMIKDLLGVLLSSEDVLAGRTPRALAAATAFSKSERDATAHFLKLSRSGEQAPLFCIHAGTGLAWPYLSLRPYLRRHAPLIGLQSPWLVAGVGKENATELASHYIDTVRRWQPEGPYRLLGWSFGGNVVIEMAAQLQGAGQEVSLLAVIDSAPPDLQRLMFDGNANDFDELMRLLNCPVADPRRALTHQDFMNAALASASPVAGLPKRTVASLPAIYKRHGELLRDPTPALFHGDMLFFSAERPAAPRPLQGRDWRHHVMGAITDVAVPAPHAEVLSGLALEVVGTKLSELLSAPP